MAHYKHLSEEERYTISAEHKRSTSLREIARQLGRSVSSISREIKRNTGGRGYRPKQANALARERRHVQSQYFRAFGIAFVAYLLSEKWSPEQIHGALTARGWLDVPSHEWIYQHVYADKAAGGQLHKHLRAQKPYKKRSGTNERRGSITCRTSIHERPPEIETRERLGDFEGDTVVGEKHKGALVTLVDRKSLFTLMKMLPSKHTANVVQACVDLLKPVGALSVTFDNGKEFAAHMRLREVGIDTFFADPYCSVQRARNENTNGLIRQYLPKGCPFVGVSDDFVAKVQDALNHRPRKTLNWLTPTQVLSGKFNVALRG
jgi:IS30 family transposase